MTGSSFIGELTTLQTTDSLLMRTSMLSPHPTHTSLAHLAFSACPFYLLNRSKGGPRFPCADGGQNRHWCRRRIFLRRCVRAALTCVFVLFLCANGWTMTEQFEDEIHPRLRFAHRGIVAMANSGKKNSNDSQFFITLGAVKSYFMTPLSQVRCWNNVDRADELHGKHTLFGRCVGDTIYSGSFFIIFDHCLMALIRAQTQMS